MSLSDWLIVIVIFSALFIMFFVLYKRIHDKTARAISMTLMIFDFTIVIFAILSIIYIV